jgi:hypothetical protein
MRCRILADDDPRSVELAFGSEMDLVLVSRCVLPLGRRSALWFVRRRSLRASHFLNLVARRWNAKFAANLPNEENVDLAAPGHRFSVSRFGFFQTEYGPSSGTLQVILEKWQNRAAEEALD